MRPTFLSSSGKLLVLVGLLRRLLALGRRVLIFSQFTKSLDYLEDLCYLLGFIYCRLDGNTPADARRGLIDSFNAPGSDKFLFLISTKAGGLGLNLQSADTVIIFDSDWNPMNDLQVS